MKLNYKRTIFVGFAFFLISAFWQAYEAIVPLMLVNKFGLDQTSSGVVMALDNVLAVFMLPIFGALSDKCKSKHGKRTPYIVIGTILAIVMFISLSFADNAQLAKINAGNDQSYQIQLFESNYEITNAEKTADFDKSISKKYTIKDYSAKIKYNKTFAELDAGEQQELEQWFAGIGYEDTYWYSTQTHKYHIFVEGDEIPEHFVEYNLFTNLITPARSAYAWKTTLSNPVPFIFFVLLLLAVLISMATFRSPAVALMPDVTIKPLRSKANAIINLMGTAGAMLVLALGIIFGTGKVQNQTSSFTWYIVAVCAIMAVGLALFITLVREPKWSKEMEEESKRLGLETESDEIEDLVDGEVKESSKGDNSGIKELFKNDKPKFISLILILLSVALWYTGYNAASSKYSLYATNILHKDYNTTLLIAQAAAIIAYIPAGILASKIGRRKTILSGVALLTTAFGIITAFNAQTPTFAINLVFALGGIGWATINVNSFPMVVELAKGGNIGKYTGYYYTASMAAQIITPILSGAVMDLFGGMQPLFYYSTIFIALSFVTMFFVKHGDVDLSKKELVAEVVSDANLPVQEETKESEEKVEEEKN
ncbi:MAG: MFS transporter [Clostridia bacterium]|nr:MFS transporter [Clostridia bacterium]